MSAWTAVQQSTRQIRKDPITGRWVIIAPDRRHRPNEFTLDPPARPAGELCPFCEGHERHTPPEVLGYRHSGAANGPGWDVRVVPNKFPALQVAGTLTRDTDGIFDRLSGIGAHEVVIETPDHQASFLTMPVAAIERVLRAFRERVIELKRDQRFRCILIFKNHGAAAGATLEHPHSQLIALPIVPGQIAEEIEGARRHFTEAERCVYCDIVRQEQEGQARFVSENADIVALAPYAPRFAFETWLLPRQHGASFEDASRHEYESLARMLKEVLQRISRAVLSPAFNLVVHSAPFQEPGLRDVFHWHVEIMPRLTGVGGFEWGSGCFINAMAPEEAATVLREAAI